MKCPVCKEALTTSEKCDHCNWKKRISVSSKLNAEKHAATFDRACVFPLAAGLCGAGGSVNENGAWYCSEHHKIVRGYAGEASSGTARHAISSIKLILAAASPLARKVIEKRATKEEHDEFVLAEKDAATEAENQQEMHEELVQEEPGAMG
jgi:hypothetical protein